MIGPLAYIGGKRRLARRLIALFPEHTTYVEPFCGGAQVFFAKEPSPIEVLNDLSGEIVNFLKICKYHGEELARSLKFVCAGRQIFDEFEKQDPASLTDVQRAARFLYLQKNSFGGKVNDRNYHYCVEKPPNYNPTSLPGSIAAAGERLARVQIECWPYERVLERFDRKSTFFYLDPPYVGVDFYKFNLSDDDFTKLADRLGNIRGKFLLSVNDHPVAREAFARFHCRTLRVAYTLAPTVPTVRELVFANYDLPPEAAVPAAGEGA